MKYFAVILLTLFVISCDQGAKTPEGLIKMYIQDLTQKKVDRTYFEKYTTGKLLETVTSLDDEEFKKFVGVEKLANPRIDISNKNCAADSCTLTYIIKYDIVENNSKEFSSEVKKVATLIKDEDIWKISEVTNVKTFIEGSNPIEVLK